MTQQHLLTNLRDLLRSAGRPAAKLASTKHENMGKLDLIDLAPADLRRGGYMGRELEAAMTVLVL
jgi:hypothetical protein